VSSSGATIAILQARILLPGEAYSLVFPLCQVTTVLPASILRRRAAGVKCHLELSKGLSRCEDERLIGSC
jgi:hypothetical protein